MAFDLQAAVRRVVNEADPMGLLNAGFPADEYDPEVSDFVKRIEVGEQPTTQVVGDVMLRWFGWSNVADESTMVMVKGLAQLASCSVRRRAGHR